MKLKFVFILLMSVQLVVAQHQNQLWYDEPADNWNEALPIGNGRIGGMIFGNAAKDQIQLNEETIWAGEPGNNVPEGTYANIEEIRKLLFAGKYKEAQDLSNATFPRRPPEDNNYGMPYQTIGSLWLDFDHNDVQNYKRSLDIENATASTSYTLNGVEYKREYFVSYPDQVMLIHLSASEQGKISLNLKYTTPQVKNSVVVQDNALVLKGISGDYDNKTGKVKFQSIAFPQLTSGKLIENEDHLRIEGADEVTILVSIGTNFKSYQDLSGDPEKIAQQFLDKAKSKSFSTLRKDHINDYQALFNRVSLDLGNQNTDSQKLPTDERLQKFATEEDLSLVALYFQFGRYLLISSSRAGGQPANLQGIWNHDLTPPWDSKYTVNINTEMNYWPAEVTNLSELHQPLFKMIKELSETGQESATEMYKARGWNMHHNTDLWRVTGIIDGGFYGMWPMGGAWLTQHVWQHYLFTGDKEFLAEYYPVLKGIARFYADVLQEEPENQWLVVAPSMSPENKYQDGVGVSYGTTMDNQLVFDVFSNAIKASEILETDKEFRKELEAKRKRLPPMQIGKISQLQEWIKDWDREGDHHRHISHLYGLHPSAQISPFKNPDLFQAAQNTLTYRGDKSTGWSMGWKVNFWARLLNGNRSYDLIKTQLTLVKDGTEEGGTYPNLLDAHPPFQIDGNFGCTAGIAEMLLQSQDEALHLLPALPDSWKEGTMKGLKARGGFEVAINWKNSQPQVVKIESKNGGVCRIRSEVKLFSENGKELKLAKGESKNSYYRKPEIKKPLVSDKVEFSSLQLPTYYVYDLETEKNKTYLLKSN
ncbi:glycoside hydrolase family 95 protein [Zunongwangia sp. HRR-M8]|uniref:glycoside hydrolase family 95 protein n=1 Tax=Zunongwangia sp. HRR-M8 TaxID=3015170 RepID=UPI0022DE8333|nr:glycoside hydrolase family 95 protein [Zunongwangia sp. HRR-M8]WBL23339.1 glycoside hydrolase family 95 protein [Zunongwangia sp. HRR-M8]